MLGSNYPSNDYLPSNDGKYILSKVKDILKEADVTYGNLEGSLLTKKAGTSKGGANSYAFKSPEHYVNYLTDAGFDVMGIANNHVGDFGEVGRNNTIKVLGENGIAYAGLTSCPYSTFTKNGVKYGFAAFAPNNGTVSINDTITAKKIVAHLDSIVDIVIVGFHGGAEGSNFTHITKSSEHYLGENRGDPYHFSRAVINAGADVVWGSGPHVTRAIDVYKGRFIGYSLGNFATSGKFSLSGVKGIAPIINVTVNKDGVFKKAKIISTAQLDETGPIIDPKDGALNQIINLTKSDVPNAPIIISGSGEVLLKNQ